MSSGFRAILLSALPVEYESARWHLTDLRVAEERGTVFEVGAYGPWEIAIAQTGVGNAAAAIQAERAIARFKPLVALFIGIAGGIKDVRLGDVVAASKIYGYESGKARGSEGHDGFLARPDIGRSTFAMVQRARFEAQRSAWRSKVSQVVGEDEPSVFVEPIAAGEKVIASRRSSIYHFLKSTYDDTVAVEMEGRGFLEAAYANQEVDALVIRGISDLISRKSVSDSLGWQEIASRHASAFAMQILDSLSESPGMAQRATEKGTAKARWLLVLDCTIEETNKPLVDALLEHLRRFTRDANLTLRQIEAGSVVVYIEGTRQGFDLIQRAFRSGNFQEAAGFHVLAVHEDVGGRPIAELSPGVRRWEAVTAGMAQDAEPPPTEGPRSAADPQLSRSRIQTVARDIALQWPPSERGERERRSYNPWTIAQRQYDRAADRLNLGAGVREALRHAKREVTVHFPVRLDDGSSHVFTGYRVWHNLARGPAKGGIRFHPRADLDEIRALAMWMTWKCACMKIPYGGAGGSVMCDPKVMSARELERLTRRFTTEISDMIGPATDIPDPDVNTNSQVMAWMMDTYSMHRGYSVTGVVTGKPVSIGGSEGRQEATGRGVAYAIQEAAKTIDLDLIGARTVVQGFGNVGEAAARFTEELGATVVAVSDSRGGVFNRDGLDLSLVTRHKQETSSVVGAPRTRAITNDELLELDCDILIPAALGGVITERNAPRIHARIIAEAANGPTDPEADDILHERGIAVIPDILRSAGGVTVSYFEWVQDRAEFFWSADEINARLRRIMVSAFEDVQRTTVEHDVDMRQAAYMLSVSRVAEATLTRGLYP